MPRQALAVVFAGLIAAGTASASDLVIQRNGKKLTGSLKSCIGSRCQLDARSLLRDDIAWIGFATKSSTPPAITDPYKDEVHTVDGRVENAGVINLNLGQVVTELSNFKRSDVAWIHFVAPKNNNGPIVDDTGEAPAPQPAPAPSPSPAPTPQPQPQPQPQPTKKPVPQPKPSNVMKQCPADNPMGGLVVFEAHYNRGRDNCLETVRTVLRFPLVTFYLASAEKRWPVLAGLDFNESKITYEVSSTGCSGTTRNGEEQCHEPAQRAAGTWVRTPLDTKLPFIRFSAVKPSIEASSMPQEIAAAFTVPFECDGPHSHGRGGHSVGFGGFAVRDLSEYSCQHQDQMGAETKSRVFCVAKTGDCPTPNSLPGSECILHADRHATFPFSGEASWQSNNTNEELVSTRIHWDICCGCAAKAAPPEPDKDPCGSTETADSLAEQNRQKREALTDQLKDQWAEYQQELKEAAKHRADFESAARQCNLQDRATKILIGILGLFAPGGAEIEGAEAAEEIAEAAEELGELIGDPGVTLAEVIEKIIAGEDPTAAAVPNEEFQNFRKAAEEAERALGLLRGSTAEQLEERIEQCAGTITLSDATYRGARDYVEKLKSAMERIPQTQTLVNNIRQLDTDYPDLQYKAYAACVQHARCAGSPEADCDAKKPAGNWPPVP